MSDNCMMIIIYAYYLNNKLIDKFFFSTKLSFVKVLDMKNVYIYIYRYPYNLMKRQDFQTVVVHP